MKKLLSLLSILLMLSALSSMAVGCGGDDDPDPGTDTVQDQEEDAPEDTTEDTGEDTPEDVPEDVPEDSEPDMVIDMGEDTPPPLTWTDDINPIFQSRCINCHANWAGSYDGVVGKITDGSLATRMEENHRITPEQADIVLQWINNGYPE